MSSPSSLPPAAPWPPEDAAVAAAAAAAIASGDWGRYEGRHCEQLRDALRQQWRRDHALLCCSGTVATELALRGLRVADGEVILAGYDFPGNFRAIEAAGATPVLVDVAARRCTLDPAALEAAVSPTTRAIVVSHLHGQLAPMRKLAAWSAEHGVPLVEDVCQSPGADVDGRPAGSWGDVATLSFGGSKLLTAGRGGAVLTDDDAVAQRIKIFAERGNDAFPLSELQASVLLPQLQQLESRNRQRAEGARILQERLTALGGPRLQLTEPHGAAFRFAFQTDRRDALVERLASRAAPVGAGFRGFTSRRRRCRRVGQLANSAAAAERTWLLHHAALLSSPAYLEALAIAIAQAWQE